MMREISKDTIDKNFINSPLTFIPNKGQVDSKAKYYFRGTSYGFYFTQEDVVMTFLTNDSTDNNEEKKGVALALHFIDSNPDVKIEGECKASGKVNYFNGKDQSKWITDLPVYEKIIYKDLWSGIDLVFYSKDNTLKYDFILKPGASVENIKLAYKGSDGISLDHDGNLLIHNTLGVLIDERPISYQEIEGERIIVESRFKVKNQESDEVFYGFEVSNNYSPEHSLVIDPGLVFSTFLGALLNNVVSNETDKISIAIDNIGDVYIAGKNISPDFPVTLGAFEESPPLTFSTGYVTKLNSDASGLIYSTFLGGSGNDDTCRGIAVDCMGNAYVTGETDSPDFPITLGAFQEDFPSANLESSAFVTKLNPDGSKLLYSTFIGGSEDDEGNDIAIDDEGNAYITGETQSSDFPVTLGAFQQAFIENSDMGFVTKLNPEGSGLVYSTFLGGLRDDECNSIAVDDKGNAYVTGETNSDDFPITLGAFQIDFRGASDTAFVTKLSFDGSALVYSTFLGGTESDEVHNIAVDNMGNAYVVGETSSPDFPVTFGAFQQDFGNGNDDVFVSKLNPDGSALIYSTFLGGSSTDEGHGIAIDDMGNAYVTGFTNSPDFPMTVGAFQEDFQGSGNSNFGDAFVSKLNFDGSSLLYSTFLGGSEDDFGRDIAVDKEGNAYIIGFTTSSNFPVTLGAFEENFSGNANNILFDTFVAKITPTPIL
ncbi:DUF7948 domain-containing protein [Wukongibacter baidiensis]